MARVTTAEGKEMARKWLLEFHASSASLDADTWLRDFFTTDFSLQYANNPIISGDNALQMFKEVFSKLDMMTHDINYFDYVEPRIYQSATIRYLVKGDDPSKDILQIPGFATFYVKQEVGGRLVCYRAETFLDPSPVFKRMAEKGFPE